MKRLVVVAHPDDEAIWLSPVLREASLIVAAFPGHPTKDSLTEARERLRADYPFPFRYLPLRASGAFRESDWSGRRPAAYGVELLETCPPEARERYLSNYEVLLEVLDPLVASSEEVYTHNPWGEYGHEEHIQVWCAVAELAGRHGVGVWIWDGLPGEVLKERGMRLRADHYTPLPVLRTREHAFDPDLYRELRSLYQRHGAWTRGPDYEPPAETRYLEAVRDGRRLV